MSPLLLRRALLMRRCVGWAVRDDRRHYQWWTTRADFYSPYELVQKKIWADMW